jgi:hypothetical protein
MIPKIKDGELKLKSVPDRRLKRYCLGDPAWLKIVIIDCFPKKYPVGETKKALPLFNGIFSFFFSF